MLEIIFPELCSCCNEEECGAYSLCVTCRSGFRELDKFYCCIRCGVPFGFFDSMQGAGDGSAERGGKNLCADCLGGKYSFYKARSVSLYEGVLRELVHAFKYEGDLRAGDSLSRYLADNVPEDLEPYDIIVPVPVHIKKLREREFNHSVIMCRELSKVSGILCDFSGLKKIRETRSQFEIKNERERRKNVSGAFSVPFPERIRRRSVLVVDDVYTTGSTSDECSKTLITSGASRVQILTLARAKSL